MTDFARDFAPDFCVFCERPIRAAEKCKTFSDGEVACLACYHAECLPECSKSN